MLHRCYQILQLVGTVLNCGFEYSSWCEILSTDSSARHIFLQGSDLGDSQLHGCLQCLWDGFPGRLAASNGINHAESTVKQILCFHAQRGGILGLSPGIHYWWYLNMGCEICRFPFRNRWFGDGQEVTALQECWTIPNWRTRSLLVSLLCKGMIISYDGWGYPDGYGHHHDVPIIPI